MYAIGGGLITIFFGVLMAYGLSRHVFPGKRTFLTALLVVQLIPGLVRIIPVFVMMSRLRLVDSRIGIILLYGAGGIAYAAWFLKGYFDAIPVEIDESAWIDGASRFRTLWQILLPSLVPGLAALFILQFIGHWNDFTTASILLRKPDLMPLTVGTRRLLGPDENDFRLLAAASLMNAVPTIIVFAFVQRYLVSGLTAGAVK
jgi:ABC-type glycerol-3-phosphate transport system permease component